MWIAAWLSVALVLSASSVSAETGQCHAQVVKMAPTKGSNIFSVVAMSKQGEAQQVSIIWKPGSTQPAKQIAELQLLECGLRDWFHEQYKVLLNKQVGK